MRRARADDPRLRRSSCQDLGRSSVWLLGRRSFSAASSVVSYHRATPFQSIPPTGGRRDDMNTLQTIKELAAKQFGGDPNAIDADAPVDKLGLDSLGFLEFLFELEDAFSISIPQESVASVRTLNQLAAAVDALIAAKSASPS